MFDVMDLIKRCINRCDHEEINQHLQAAYDIAEKIYSEKIKAKEESAEKGDKVTNIDKSLFPITAHSFLDVLTSDKWPEATPQFLICNDTEDDKNERAEGIMDFIESNLAGIKLLDFGCGEGHVVKYASQTALKAVGYDLKQTGNLVWEDNSSYLLTTDLTKVVNEGPYNLIILYDVLDHVEDPVSVLRTVKSLCTDETKLFIRFHTFMSRHGTHLYRQYNKAWLQVFFSDEELLKMGLKNDIKQIVYYPLHTQRKWITEAGLKIKSEDVIKTTVEDIFKTEQFKARLPKEFKGKEFPEWQMSQIFNDYIVGK